MKTAVSLPDSLFRDAEETAKSLGIPRSQLFAKALAEFIENHNRIGITQALDAVYVKMDKPEVDLRSTVELETLRELTRNDAW
jgi:metal-responsive CopG/Arc/MetJ family transcriptional regulator